MKKSVTVLSVAAMMTVALQAQSPEEQKALIQEGVKYIKMVGKELKSQVGSRMKKDPSGKEAVSFCLDESPRALKKVVSQFPGHVKVRRTALKYRNPDHKPDALDVKVMEDLQARMQAGTFEKKPFVVEAEGGVKRVYVPIVVEKGCLKCHGPREAMDPQIRSMIAKKYPQDKAVDFHEGDLRGVAVAEIAPKQ